MDYIIDFNRIILLVYVFLCYLLIFLFIYISFLLLFFLFIVILHVFLCEIIQSHLFAVLRVSPFSPSCFFFFFFEGGGGGQGAGRTARYKDLNIVSQDR